ncbi:M48 family metallopeptidase [Haladaptatus sp. NG-SE-30]
MDNVVVWFLALLVGTRAFFSFLSWLNLRYGEKQVRAEREWVEETLDVNTTELLTYQRAQTQLSFVRSWVALIAVLVVLFSGILTSVVNALGTLGFSSVAEGIVFFIGLNVVQTVFFLPFNAYSTFVVEERFGFNNQSVGLWLRDKAVEMVVISVILAVVAGFGLAVIDAFPETWWLIVVAGYVVFQLLMQVIFPRIIMPLFYDFEPVEAGELRTAIDDVFERVGFETSNIYTMNASSRSGKSNAFFSGFGRTKRVVLFDTLVEQMSIPELQSVLAHELCHWREHHIWKHLALGAIQFGVVTGGLWWLLQQPWLTDAFAIPDTTYLALFVGVLLANTLLKWVSPLTNRVFLHHEYAADAYAANVVGVEPMASALERLTGENLSNPFPHPLYAAFYYDHPPMPARIRAIRDQPSEEGSADVTGGAPGSA